MKKEKILITGCGGMLGEAVYQQLKDKYEVCATDIDLNEPWLEHLDVSDDEQVQTYGRKLQPDFVIHLAALTDMEYCEMHPQKAYRTNAHGAENIANLAKELDIPLIYISTAGIFDGNKNEYDETDEPVPPAPLSIYGKSKYAGELVARTWPKSIIIRAGWMIGGGPQKDKKFVNKIIKQLQTGIKELAVVDDKFGTPTYTYDLARAMDYLLEHRLYGLYNGSCDGGDNRHGIAVCILEHLGLKEKVRAKVVNSDYFKETYFAPRPTSEQLSNKKLKTINPQFVRDWRECLKEYLEKFDWGIKDA